MYPVVKNWLDLSKYDYVTAKAMLNSRRYLYVAFTCQQSIEKMLKAIFCTKKNETPPYTHNLIKMADAAEVTNLTEEIIEFINYLNAFYIESRYTEQIKQLDKSVNSRKAREIYIKTGEIIKWLKKMIP